MMRKARSKADKAELKQLIEKNKQRIKHMWEKNAGTREKEKVGKKNRKLNVNSGTCM